MEVRRLDPALVAGEPVSPKTGLPLELPEKTLGQAKAEIGACLRKTIDRTGAKDKEFGDSSQVNRVCNGDIPAPLARAWQTVDRRKQFVLALAEASGCFRVHISIDEEKAS